VSVIHQKSKKILINNVIGNQSAGTSASITALGKLLARQKSEVQETEHMLKRFNSTLGAGNAEKDISLLLSTAASIVIKMNALFCLITYETVLVYFIVLCHLWVLALTILYQFLELLETHALQTVSR
jgi:hypothetical protein